MAEIERVTVALPASMAERLKAAVETGEYATTSEAIRDALRLWDNRRQSQTRDAAALREAWEAGRKSGKPQPLDLEAVIARARTRLG